VPGPPPIGGRGSLLLIEGPLPADAGWGAGRALCLREVHCQDRGFGVDVVEREPGQRDVEVQPLEVGHLGRQQFIVPTAVLGHLVVGDHIGALLRLLQPRATTTGTLSSPSCFAANTRGRGPQ
jgi:hypothetical protein